MVRKEEWLGAAIAILHIASRLVGIPYDLYLLLTDEYLNSLSNPYLLNK